MGAELCEKSLCEKAPVRAWAFLARFSPPSCYVIASRLFFPFASVFRDLSSALPIMSRLLGAQGIGCSGARDGLFVSPSPSRILLSSFLWVRIPRSSNGTFCPGGTVCMSCYDLRQYSWKKLPSFCSLPPTVDAGSAAVTPVST